MLLGRRRYAGFPGPSVRRLGLVLVVVALAVSGLVGVSSLVPAASSPSTAVPHSVASPISPDVTPATVFPPSIFSFTATPSTVFAGNETDLSVFAYDNGDVLNYFYFNLPAGCFSSNSSFLPCVPIFGGTFTITVQVTDTSPSNGLSSQATVSITVYPGSPQVGNGEFFTVDPSTVTNLNQSDAACRSINNPPFYQNFCYPEAQAPSLLSLGNGNIGLATQLYTNLTANTCPGAALATVARVGFSVSANGGNSFGPAVTLGNDTCTYLNAIEPSFGASGSHVYGVFVEENSSLFAADYANRTGDALGFVSSANNGATFGPVRTIATGFQFARPQLSVVGSKIYIVYEKIDNSSRPIGGNVFPIAVNMLYSANAGVLFHGPFKVPGLNRAAGFNAMSPAVTENQTGTIAIAYATNRTCLSPGPGGTCNEYGESVVVVTSANNGATWLGPFVVAKGAGETNCYTGACLPAFFQSTPQISIAYAPTGTDLYVAYAATYSQGPSVGLGKFSPTGVFAAMSADGGVDWSGGAIAAPMGTSLVRSFNPGLGVSPSGVFLTYLQANATGGPYGFADSLSQWWDSSPLASSLSWAPPNAVDIESFAASGGSVNATRSSYPGESSSIAFTATGTPVVGFSIPLAPTTTIQSGPGFYYVNTTYETDLAVGVMTTDGGPGTVSVVFMQSGIPLGLPWSFTLNGLSYTLTAPAIEFDNLPAGAAIIDGASYLPGFWTIVTTYFNASVQEYFFNQTVTFAFEVWVGLEFNTFPAGVGPWIQAFEGEQLVTPDVLTTPFPAFISAQWEEYGQFSFVNGTFSVIPTSIIDYFSNAGNYFVQCQYVICAYPGPWYFPLGTTLQLNYTEIAYNQLAPIWWTGQGAGSYSGPVLGSFCFDDFECPLWSGTITLDNPVNETVWLGDSPENLSANVTIAASGLPSSSQFSVTLDSNAYSAPATSSVTINDVAPGSHALSGISATSTTPGWEYFGHPVGPNPFVSPIETGVDLAFDSFVHVSAPPGNVSFYAPDLAAGTTWSIALNDSTYTSSTPWINLTTRPGTYPWSAGDAVTPGGSTGYVPTTPPGNLSVTSGSQYTVNYATAYQVVVLSATGGLVSVQSGPPTNAEKVWAAGGATIHLSALTSPGYSFTGWSGVGPGAYSGNSSTPSVVVGGPVVETASFVPLPGARFNLSVLAEGLPANTWWTVNLDGAGHSSNASGLTVDNLWPWSAGPQGHYTLGVPVVYQSTTNLTRYVPAGHAAVVGTNGSFTPPLVLDFSPQVFVQVSGSTGGAVEATYQGSPVGTSAWIPQGAGISISASPDPGYVFSGWEGSGGGSYTGTASDVGFNATGPVTEVATFTPTTSPTLLRYSLTFSLTTPLVTGTEWSVTFGGQGYSSTGTSLTISGLSQGTYGLEVNSATSPDGLVQYRAAANDPVAYTVNGNATEPIGYASSYWVAVSASVGGTVSPGPGWYAAGSVLYLVATANSTYAFTSWTGSGAGNYAGSNSTAAVIVTGPLTETASFSSSSSGAVAATIWQSPDTWIGLGAVGLVAGLAIGLVGARWGTKPTPRRTGTAAPPAPGSSTRGNP